MIHWLKIIWPLFLIPSASHSSLFILFGVLNEESEVSGQCRFMDRVVFEAAHSEGEA